LVANKLPGGNPLDEEVDWQRAPTEAAPQTRIARAVIKKHAASFAFAGTGPATAYRCSLREGRHKATVKRCSSPLTYKRLKPGRYTFSVIASGPGEPYRTPARRSFRVR